MIWNPEREKEHENQQKKIDGAMRIINEANVKNIMIVLE